MALIIKPDKKGIKLAVQYLKAGKSVVYPTDTSYGLGVDATNIRALERLYKIKQRKFGTPIHIVVPSVAFAKKVTKWNELTDKLVKKFWPGPLTLVLELKNKRQRAWTILSGGSGAIGLRIPDNKVAMKLAKFLNRPVTTTSANPPNSLGGHDSYSVEDVVKQFKKKRYQPDLILDAGRLLKKKPSTFVKIVGNKMKILRRGPISQKDLYPHSFSPLSRGRRRGGSP